MTIHAVQLTSHEEIYAPPLRVMEVSVIDDVVFIFINKYEEDNKSNSAEVLATMGVLKKDLLKALQVWE